MTKDQALALLDTGWWKGRTADDIVTFQLFEERLCMPFPEFHKALCVALGRPVFTHELGSAGYYNLCKEFLKERPAPTFTEIMELIPEAKRIVLIRDASESLK